MIDIALSDEQDHEDRQERPRPQPPDTGVTFIVGTQTRLLPLPPDTGNISSEPVSVALDIFPPVVDAAAPGGDVLSVVHLRSLLTEHRNFVPHKWHRAAVNLKITNIDWIFLIFIRSLPDGMVDNQTDPDI